MTKAKKTAVEYAASLLGVRMYSTAELRRKMYDKEYSGTEIRQVIEDFTELMAQSSDKIWFATNIEIHDYVEDYRRLIASADGHLRMNPTTSTLWSEFNKEIVAIAPGETKNMDEFM